MVDDLLDFSDVAERVDDSKELDFSDVAERVEPGVGDYLSEAGRSIARGASQIVGQGLKSAGLAIAADPQTVAAIESGIVNIRSMPVEEAEAFRLSIKDAVRSSRLGPPAALLYEAALREKWAGNEDSASSYLDWARKLTDTRDLTDTDLYKAGQDFQASVAKDFPQDPAFRDSWTSAIGEGLGQSAGFVAAAPTGVGGIAALGGLVGGAEGYDEARRDIAANYREDRGGLYNAGLGTEAERLARRAGQATLLPGTTEAVPIVLLLDQTIGRMPMFRTPAGVKLWQRGRKALERTAMQMLEEGGQEAFQTWMNNVANRLIIDPGQSDWENVAESAAVAAITGGVLQTGVEVAGGAKDAVKTVAGAKEQSFTRKTGVLGPMARELAGTVVEILEEAKDGSGYKVRMPDGRTTFVGKRVFEKGPSDGGQKGQPGGKPPVRAKPLKPDAVGADANRPPQSAPENLDFSDVAERVEPEVSRETSVPPPVGKAPLAPDFSGVATRVGSRTAPAEGLAELDHAAAQVNTKPTDAQKEAGNYQKGHVRFHDLDITIDYPKGSQRRGKAPDGSEWTATLAGHYGYVKKSEGADGDQVDVFIGDKQDSDKVFVIDQKNLETGNFDEHKAILGVGTEEEAARLYHDSFSDDRGVDRIDHMTTMTVDEFREWVKTGDTTKPLKPAQNVAGAARQSVSERAGVPEPGKAKLAPRAPKAQETATSVSAPSGRPEKGSDGVTSELPSQSEQPQNATKTKKETADGTKPADGADDGTPAQTAEVNSAISAKIAEYRQPTENVPAAAVRQTAEEGKPQEKSNAAEEGQVEEGDLGEHPEGDQGRKAAEAGRGDRPLKGEEGVDAEAEKPGRPAETARQEDGAEREQEAADRGGAEGGEVTGQVSEGNKAFAAVGGVMPQSKLFPEVDKTVNIDTALNGEAYITPDEAAAKLAEWKAEAKRQFDSGENAKRVIFSLFDYTGKWSQPYREAGFTVIQYDIQHAKDRKDFQVGDERYDDILSFMPIADILDVRQAGYEVYGVLAATPCTTFARSGARWWAEQHDVKDRAMVEKVFGPWVPEHYESALEVNQALVTTTIAFIEFANPTGFHVMENPIGRIQKMNDLPDPLVRFHPNNFGDPYTKRTQLFGDFGTDMPTANVDPVEGSKIESKLRGDNAEDKAARSATPEGFSYAFFMANNQKSRPTEQVKGAPAFDPKADLEVSGVITKPGEKTRKGDETADVETNPGNRLVIETGVVLRTKSGRETSPAPKIDASSDRKANATILRMNAWLLDEAKKEAEASGLTFVSTLLNGINPARMSQSDQDQVNLVLFDDPEGATAANVVRVEKAEKKPKTQTEAQPTAEAKPAEEEAATSASETPEKPASLEKTGGSESVPAADVVAAPANQSSDTGNVFEDAGEKIGGARKDWRERGLDPEDLATMTAMEQAEYTTKENVWPRPDYAKLVSDGMDPTAAFFIKTIYDRLPTKPLAYKDDSIRLFVAGMSRLRSLAASVRTPDDARRIDKDFRQLYAKPDDPNNFTSEYWNTIFAMGRSRRRSANLQIRNKDENEAKLAVATGFPEQEPWRRLYSIFKSYDSKWYVVNRARTKRISPEGFETEAEAIEKARAIYEAEEPDQGETGKTPKRPTLETLQRTGKEWRSGRHVENTDEFRDAFGFKGVEFGEWANQKERQLIVDAAYDAFYDLAEVLNLPPKAMSFAGLLSMGFGSRGRGSFLAHYEPHRLVINMTKLRGAGALAHEWGHALDHYLGELYAGNPYGGAANWLTGGHQTAANFRHSLNLPAALHSPLKDLIKAIYFRAETNEEMQKRLDKSILSARKNRKGWDDHRQDLIDTIKRYPERRRSISRQIEEAADHVKLWTEILENAERIRRNPKESDRLHTHKTNYVKEAEKLSGTGDYWKRNNELFARSFEAYVFDKLAAQGGVNQYLVHGVEDDRFAGDGFKGNPYPAGDERIAINKAYDRLIAALKSDQEGKIGIGEGGWAPSDVITNKDEAIPLEPYQEESAESQPIHDTRAGEEINTVPTGSEQVVDEIEDEAQSASEETSDDGSESLRGTSSEIPAETQPENVSQPATGGDTGTARPGDGGTGGGTVSDDRVPDDGLAVPADGLSSESGGPRGDTSDGGRDRPERDRVPTPPELDVEQVEAERDKRRALNYRITSEDRIGQGTPKQKVHTNIEAIRVLKTVESDVRQATEEEKRTLVRYVGWGAFAQDVFAEHKPEWASERADLKNLLSPDEFAAARRSTLNAHYTSQEVIEGMWSALSHLGYRRGRALEPSSGVGHFVGLAPNANSDWSLVELDGITGRIAKLLYAGSDVNVMGFEEFKRPKGFYDLAISNVPFGDYRLTDPAYPPMFIHDYFFVKALDLVRPGGIVAFITSSGTMDKANDRARKEIIKRADLLGAIRLPGGRKGAFAGNAGTQVTTDILFLRRREEGANPSQFAKSWFEIKEISTQDGPVSINEYFAANPKMMLGEMRLTGTMYGSNQPVLEGTAEKIAERIQDVAREFLPKDVFQPVKRQADKPTAPVVGADGVKEGAYFVKDGTLYRKILGVGQDEGLSETDIEKVKALVGIRDIVNDLLKSTAEGKLDATPHLREKLNKAYDAFVRKHGHINKVDVTVTKKKMANGDFVTMRRFPNFRLFRRDPDAYKVSAIEVYDEETGKASKATIFTRDIISRSTAPVIMSAADALAVVMDRTGSTDLAEVAKLRGQTEAAVIKELGDLIYDDPAGHGWQTAQEYLSGDVLSKLEDARAAAKTDQKFERNVKALEKVQPKPIHHTDIRVPFGASWVPPEIFEDFINEHLGTSVTIRANPLTKKWSVIGYFDRAANALWGHPNFIVDKMVDAAINQTMVLITQKNIDGTTSKLEKETLEVRAKIEEIRNLFVGNRDLGQEGWIWRDAARIQTIAPLYNRLFNRIVTRTFDGAHLAMPGLTSHIKNSNGEVVPFKLRPHQKNAIWRVIQTGNTLLAHVVGAGKTFTMIGAGMEMKRLGQIQRPMYVVPNHMLEQFSREFLQAYPNANILVANQDEMAKDQRKIFAAKVAAQAWDAIIITHNAFGSIAMSDDAYVKFLEEEIDEIEDALVAAGKDAGMGNKKDPTVKDLEKAKARAEEKIRKLQNKEAKDEGVIFEELGVDFLFVDEAHLFKNLVFYTRHKRVKGLGQGDAQRATDLFMKVRWLNERRPGRSAVFATGTPLSNTVAEAYTMQRYLQLPKLKEYGIDRFDAWASTFGELVTRSETSADGRTFKDVTSFSRFVNIPELVAIYNLMADTQTANMLNLPRPTLKNNKVTVVESAPNEREEAYIQSLIKRLESIKGAKPERGADNALKIVSEGRKVATDYRLIDSDASFNETGKVAKAINGIFERWKTGKEPGLVQMVFLDMGTPKTKPSAAKVKETVVDEDGEEIVVDVDDAEVFQSKFNLYQDIKDRLVARGIPRDQIAFIHDAQTDDKKAILFSKVRAAKVRVLIGSTAKMGVGTNVQDRLIAMHEIDAPWKPAEVEQRNGRILRQGNLNPEIELIRYVTTRSFDAFMWQTLERKANFIGQFQSGAKGLREAEDIDSPMPEAAELKAAASGDPRLLQRAELQKKVRELDAARRSHEQSLDSAMQTKKSMENEIASYETEIAALDKDLPKVKDVSSKNFEVKMAGQTVTTRKEAGTFMKEALLAAKTTHWSHDTWTKALGLGELSGFKMLVMMRGMGGGVGAQPGLRGARVYEGDDFILHDEIDDVGLVMRFENILNRLADRREVNASRLANKREQLARVNKQIADDKGFPRQKELDDVKDRLAALEKEMKDESAAREAEVKARLAAEKDDDGRGPLASFGRPDQQERARLAASPIRRILETALSGFGYKIVDTGLPFGYTDHWGKFWSFGTQIIDKAIPGSDVGKWMDSGWKASPELRSYIKEHMTAPWAHRVWFGHDPAANIAGVIDRFGIGAIPDYALQLLKDSMTKAGIPLPGVQWLVQGGLVSDRFATAWLSLNIGEALSGGLSILGTYRLYRQVERGEQVHAGWAIAGILFKMVGGTLSANPVVLISAAADVVLLARATLAGTRMALIKDASLTLAPGAARMAPRRKGPARLAETKVVDAQGNPLLVYHGSSVGADTLKIDGSGIGQMGIWFTESPDLAGRHALGDEGRTARTAPAIHPVYLDMRNPFVVDGGLKDALTLGLRKHWYGLHHGSTEVKANAVKALKKAGYDGVIGYGGGVKEYVVFDERQVVSAFDPGIAMTKMPLANDPRILGNIDDIAPPFYSALLRTVENMKPQSGTKAQWMGMIRNAPGVKPEEINWIGLEDFLAERQGPRLSPEHITKQEVVDFIRANQVQVQEVVKGGDKDALKPRDVQAVRQWATRTLPNNGEMANALNALDRAMDGDASAVGDLEGLGVPEPLLEPFRNSVGSQPGGPTKHSKHQLPGGENYRELLLTLPTPPDRSVDTTGWKVVETPKNFAGNFAVMNAKGEVVRYWEDALSDEDMIEQTAAAVAKASRPANWFTNGHWSEPNVLAHVRFNERTSNDKRVLFIEEIQSDWGQAARKRGVRPNVTESELRARRVAAGTRLVRALRADDNLGFDSGSEAVQAILNHPEDFAQRWEMSPESIAAAREAIAIDREFKAFDNGIPDAPFIKSTNDWAGLALKRMIRWAAENGFDEIAWTPGDEQANRYDLSKVIEQINWTTRPGIGKVIMVVAVQGGFGSLQTNVNGKVIIAKGSMPATLQDKMLDNIFGKDIAEKIMAEESGTIEEDGLRVGGHGMRGFYDKILVDAANKLGKKFGAKVGIGQVVTSTNSYETARPWVIFDATDDGEGAEFERFPTRKEAEDYIKERDLSGVDIKHSPVGGQSVHSLPITDAMRESVMRGQPLFNARHRLASMPPFVLSRRQVEFARKKVQELSTRILGHTIKSAFVERMPNYVPESFLSAYDHEGKAVWISMRAANDLAFNVGHEALHALRDLNVFLDHEWRILVAAARRQGYALSPERVSRYRQTYVDKYGMSEAQFADVMDEEAVADMLGDYVHARENANSTVQKILDKIRDWAAAMIDMMGGLGIATSGQLLSQAYRGVLVDRKIAPTQTETKVPALGMMAAEPFIGPVQNKAIDDILADRGPRKEIPFYSVPKVLAALGLKVRALILSPGVIWKAIDKHGMTPTQIKEALNGLDDPVMVFDSATKKDALVVLVDVAGEDRPVVVTVHQAENIGRIEVGRVTSVHPRASAVHVQNWLDNGLARYINQRKTGAWVRPRGLQLPKRGSPKHRLGKKVLQYGDVFNPPIVLGNVPPDDAKAAPPPADLAADPEAADILEDIAGNLNLRRIKAPDDIKAMLRQVAREAGDFIAERRGVVSNEQTAALAAELGMTPKELLARETGEAFNAHQIFAARTMLIKSAQRVKALAKIARRSTSLADLAEFQKAVLRHRAIQEQIAGLTAEAGRALQQFNMIAGKDYLRGIDVVLSMAKKTTTGRRSAVEGEEEMTRELADMIDALDDPDQIGRFIAEAHRATIWDMVREAWINGLLSGFRTHATNILSNTLTAIWQVPETGLAAAIGAVHGGERVYGTEAAARLIGLLEGTKEGISAAAHMIRTGDPLDAMSKIEAPHRKAIPGMAGEIIRLPSRMLEAEDQFFKAVNYRAAINALAVRQALAEARRGAAFSRRVAELRAHPSRVMAAKAHQEALYNTFQNKLGKDGQLMMRLREAIPLAWLIMPFIRTPVNIIKYAAERTVFGLAMRPVRDNLTGKNGVIARDTQLARLTMGSAIMAAIVAMAAAGMVSGGPPDDPDEDRILRATGWQPYSIKIGETWYSYQRIDPMALVVGIAADLVNLSEHIADATYDQIATMVVNAIADNMKEKTWISGAVTFLEAFFSGDAWKLDAWGRRLAGSVIPAFVGQVAQWQDDTLREARTMLDTIKSRTPGLSQTLMPRRNVFGEETKREGALGPDLVSPIYMSSEKNNPIANEMVRLGYFPGMPTRVVNGHRLTPEQYDIYARISGEMATERLQKRIAAPGWSRMQPDDQIDAMKEIFENARAAARTRLKKQWPELSHK